MLHILACQVRLIKQNFLYYIFLGENPIIFEEGKEVEAAKPENLKRAQRNELIAYFELNANDPEARKYTFVEINTHYWYDKSPKKWLKRKKQIGEVLVRIGAVNPTKPELVALRLLMMVKRGPKSYEDVRTIETTNEETKTVERTIYPTFAEAAQAMGLMEKDDMWIACMNEFLGEKVNAYKFRRFFAMILFHSKPSNPKALFEHFIEQLAPTRSNLKTKEEKIEFALQRIEFLLHQFNTDCDSLGLPTPKHFNYFDMEKEEVDDFFGGGTTLTDDPKSSRNWKNIVQSYEDKFNNGQTTAFTEIIDSANGKNSQRLYYIGGAGGCGKTTLFMGIIAQLRADGKYYVATATTGIAALLLPGGQTAHSAFRIANDIDEKSTPVIKFESIFAQKLRDAAIIFIDEVSMLNKDVLSYIDKTLRSIYPINSVQRKTPFANKVIVLSGDFCQLPPVVPGGGKGGELAASIISSELFKNFKKHVLTQNMRVNPEEVRLNS